MPDTSADRHGLPRNVGIDLVRGVSIVLVTLHHVGLRIPLHRTALASVIPVRVLKAINFNGLEAVVMFFVISGFLIATNVIRRWGTLGEVGLRDFYVRRGARIVPCLALLIAVLSLLHLTGAQDYVISRPGQSLGGAVRSAALLHLNWYEGQTGYLPGGWDVLWSLSVEEAFYLGFPLVCLLFRRTRWLAPPLVLLALSLPLTRAALKANQVWQEKAYLPGMAAIAAGVLGAMLVAALPVPRRWLATALGVTGGLGVLVVLFAEDLLWPTLGEGTVLLLVASTVCIAVASCWQRSDAGQRAPGGLGWLQSFGRLSYEVYLTHMFVVVAVVRLWRARGADLRYPFAWYGVAMLAVWVLGWAVARFLSAPCERAIKRRFHVVSTTSASPSQEAAPGSTA
jgi:peptidoglycan/LPS O-acetylase OafA/YrhL